MALDCSVGVLVAASKCYCLDRRTQAGILNYLLCQWANAGAAVECGTPSIYIQISGASDPNADGLYVNWSPVLWVGPSYVIGPFISSYTINFTGGQWELINHHSLAGDTTLYVTSIANFPCTWTVSPFSIPPAPTGQYIPAIPPPPPPVPPSLIVIDDGTGGLWRLVVDAGGNVGADSTVMPATPDIILADGIGGFWKIVVDVAGHRGTTPSVGPATPVPTLDDGVGGFWKLIVQSDGTLGTVSVP